MNRAAIDRKQPAVTHRDLALCFLKIALVSFGGGLSAWARQVIIDERQWLTDEEFLTALTLAQALTGTERDEPGSIRRHAFSWTVRCGCRARRSDPGAPGDHAQPGGYLFPLSPPPRHSVSAHRGGGRRSRTDPVDGSKGGTGHPASTDAGRIGCRCLRWHGHPSLATVDRDRRAGAHRHGLVLTP